MASSYIPAAEAPMDNWVLNFKTKIALSPTTYGLTTSDATAITTAYTNWHTAYLAANDPATRTEATIETKNEQKQIVLGVVRGYAAAIRVNHAVSNALKIDLGLHVASGPPTPVPPPQTAPVLAFRAMRPGKQEVEAKDEGSDRRGKPAGTSGLLLFRFVGAASTTDPAQATFLSFVTRPDFEASYTITDNGKTATYFARWTNGKGELGPWSMPLSMPIAA